MSANEHIEEIDLSEAPRFAGARLAYIKTIGVTEARALGVIPPGVELPASLKLYAIHMADGTPVAIMDNRDAALGTALSHELVPLSVH